MPIYLLVSVFEFGLVVGMTSASYTIASALQDMFSGLLASILQFQGASEFILGVLVMIFFIFVVEL